MMNSGSDLLIETPITSSLQNVATASSSSFSASDQNGCLEENLRRHPLLPACRCRKHCYNLFSEQSRTHIHRSFWSLDHFSRGLWIFNRITNKPVSKLKKPTKSGSNRSCVRAYFLETSFKVHNPEIVNVCQKFFLSTLGYKSDKVITYTLKVFKDVKDHSKLIRESDDHIITEVDGQKIKSDCAPFLTAQTSIPSSSGSHTSITHPLLPPCACKQNCLDKFCENERQLIHSKFWNMSYSDRKHWLYSCIKSLPIQRRVHKKSSSGPKRTCSRQYFLPLSTGKNVCVCQKFFLSTLGYSNDKIIVHTISALSNSAGVALASSGRKSKNKLNDTLIELMRKHIASNSAELKKRSVKKLFDDFISSNPKLKKKPSYESYRLLVVKMNVRDKHKFKRKNVCSPGGYIGKTELDIDELHYFEDLDLVQSPNLGYPSYLEQLTSSLPLEIPLPFPPDPKPSPLPKPPRSLTPKHLLTPNCKPAPSPQRAANCPESGQSSQSTRQSNRPHQFLVMPGNSLVMGHLVTNDNLIML